ncbi:MAG: undecaprenyldiphospho-muramoylpentapeptide beta-N-acetylglucosaminyltransferase [Treponema sp.]|nr:undecaprenyldiphospho-muramoylpentapeptide beta-N-acetylglucosaminyltransferase [Treponema sp.]
MKKNNKIVIALTGGGTGGHIYPGLAVADELRTLCADKEIKLIWIGCSKGMDRTIVEKNCGPDSVPSIDKFYGIPSGKLRRYFSFKNVTDPFKIMMGCICSFFILLKNRPAVLFSKGGFVSVPPCFAAKILGIPVFTHECDYTPGLANRINSRFAKKLLVSYEETKKYLASKSDKVVVTGNPVRPVFYNTDLALGKQFLGLPAKSKKPVLLVMGGSLGAKQINDLVSENISWLCQNFYVVHQTGQKNGFVEPELDEKLKDYYKPYPFIYNEMPHVIAASDVVLSRAGANSLWECAVLTKPMVLIPLCGAGTRGDQVDNAEFFASKDAAIVLTGKNATSSALKNALESMLDKKNRTAFSKECKAILPADRPAYKIAKIIFDQAFSEGSN